MTLGNSKPYMTYQQVLDIVASINTDALRAAIQLKTEAHISDASLVSTAQRLAHAAVTGIGSVSATIKAKGTPQPSTFIRPTPLPTTAHRKGVYFLAAADTRSTSHFTSATPATEIADTLLQPIRKDVRDKMDRIIISACRPNITLDSLLNLIMGADGTGTHGHADWGIAFNVAFIILFFGEEQVSMLPST
jgi:hypothetical protein